MPDGGNMEQVRMVAEQVAEAAFYKFEREHPVKTEATIPAPLKWAGAIIAGLFTAGTATLVFWLVSSVSEMQVTLARMDERMASGMIKDARFDDVDRRITKLESYHAEGGR
jgi:hypothetical protein